MPSMRVSMVVLAVGAAVAALPAVAAAKAPAHHRHGRRAAPKTPRRGLTPRSDGGVLYVDTVATPPGSPRAAALTSGSGGVSAPDPSAGATGATGPSGTTVGGASVGTTTAGGVTTPTPPAPSGPVSVAVILPSGLAQAPADAPPAVRAAIDSGNQLIGKPYVYGGGHKSFVSAGYDCSGAVSFALHGGGLLDSPLDSGSLEQWGVAGAGQWISVYANVSHTYAEIAGIRLDTSRAGDATGQTGPRWRPLLSSHAGYVARHPAGL